MTFDPRLLKSDADRAECAAELARLRMHDDDAARSRIELLEKLLELYEEDTLAALNVPPLDAIRRRMEERGLRQKDVARWFGGRNRVSEVLCGRRALTPAMIATLSRELNIPAKVLLAGATRRKRTPAPQK